MPPISPDSLHYLFDPTSIGSLHRKVAKGEFITAEELASIAEADRAAFADPVFQEYVLLALRNELPKRTGRPPEDAHDRWLTLMADHYIQHRAAEIRAQPKADRADYLSDPRMQAAQEFSDDFWLNITPQALHNRIRRVKKGLGLSVLSRAKAP